MRIKYPVRLKALKFWPEVEEEVKGKKNNLVMGQPIEISLSERGGYDYKIMVRIEKDEKETFWTDWKQVDPTRFPARIKTAAFALFRAEIYGGFIISHYNGELKIE